MTACRGSPQEEPRSGGRGQGVELVPGGEETIREQCLCKNNVRLVIFFRNLSGAALTCMR